MKLFLFDPHVHERPMLQKKIAANLQAFRTQVLKRERNKKKEKEKESSWPAETQHAPRSLPVAMIHLTTRRKVNGCTHDS